jgi:putative ABC transport system permease protein
LSWPLAATLVALVAIAAAVGGWAGTGQVRSVLTATGRAVVQLLAVGAVIGVIFRTPALAPLYLLVMVTAAAWTSGRRLAGVDHAVPIAAVAITAGSLATVATVLIGHAVAFEARTAVPFAAQLIGGSMTATTLAGRRMLDDLDSGWDQVEAWLALGATPRQATREPARLAASRAVVPALDQTRNVGLVVLPGAFVGLLLGGATPIEAGKLQLLVLVGLLTAETIAAVVVTSLISAHSVRIRPQTTGH